MLQHLVGLSTERSDIHASRVATHPPILCGSGWCGRCDWQAKSSLAVFFKLDTCFFFFFIAIIMRTVPGNGCGLP